MISQIKISHNDLELIQGELDKNTPYEACGALVGTREENAVVVIKTVPITNVNRTKQSFELDPKEFYEVWDNAEQNGTEIIGVYHTHPSSSAVPSNWDRETMENDPSVWLIAGADGMKAYVWDDDGVESVEIIES